MKNINKIVLILGASSDIGEYYANYYSNLGYIVVLTYNNSYKEENNSLFFGFLGKIFGI